MDDAGHRLSRYFIAQLSVNAAFGCVIGGGFALIGVPSPVLWGVMGMLLRFVPYIGSPIAAVLPIALAAAVDPGWSMAIWTALLFLVVELLTGQVVEPILYGHSTGLSPVAVIIAAIFWTWIWGPIGLILSTPLTLCLVVMGQHVKRLKFLDILLGDQPALTPIESFYQRMLAGDPDEAQEQAEAILREHSLAFYYDQVALPGLQLASNDALRGVLTVEQMARLRGTVEDLVRDLDEHEDSEPPADAPAHAHHLPRLSHLGHLAGAHPVQPITPMELPPGWESDAPVLCLAGRGPVDEAASSMLAQLLAKHGLKARMMPHVAASRARIASLPLDGVAMVCIAHLDLEGAPAHLRNLVRRLRQRLPSQPILVGLWPPTDGFLLDPRMRATIGADFYVSNFHEAVTACLDTARHGGEPQTDITHDRAARGGVAGESSYSASAAYTARSLPRRELNSVKWRIGTGSARNRPCACRYAASRGSGTASTRPSVTCGANRRRSGSRPIRCKAVSTLLCKWSSACVRSTPAHSAVPRPPFANRPTPASVNAKPGARRAPSAWSISSACQPGASPMKRRVR